MIKSLFYLLAPVLLVLSVMVGLNPDLAQPQTYTMNLSTPRCEDLDPDRVLQDQVLQFHGNRYLVWNAGQDRIVLDYCLLGGPG